MKGIRAGAVAGLVTAVPLVGAVAVTTPAQAHTVLCGRYDTATVAHRYVVQNNVWGADTRQCLTVNSTGFTVTRARHRNATDGPPASYPSIYYGCHYGTCSPHTILPVPASAAVLKQVRTRVSVAYPTTGVWDASYDLWFDPTPRLDGQNTGAELMIWLNRRGPVQPAGQRVATVHLAGADWEVWYDYVGWNVISYLRTAPASSISFAVDSFYADAVARGYAQRTWYLTSVQAGFEPWVGGTGLALSSFSVVTG